MSAIYTRGISNRSAIVLLTAVCAVGLGIRLANIGRASLWLDEAWLALSVGSANLRDVVFLGPTGAPNSSPYLFSLATHFIIQVLGNTEWTLRLLPALSSAATIPATYLLARLLKFSRAAAIMSASLLAFNPLAISFAKEFKQYSGDALVTVSLLALGEWCLVGCNLRRVGVLLVAGIVALGFSHTAAVIAVSLVIVSVTAPPAGSPWRFRASTVLIAGWSIGFALTYWLVLRHQIAPILVQFWKEFYPATTAPHSAVSLFIVQFPSFFGWVFGGGRWVAAVLYAVGLVAAYRLDAIRALAYCVLPWFTTLALAVLHRYPFGAVRVDLFLVPLLILPVGLGAALIIDAIQIGFAKLIGGRPGVGPIAVLIALLACSAIYSEWSNPKSKEELRPLVEIYLQNAAQADQTILIDERSRYAFQYYTRSAPHRYTIYDGPFEAHAVVAFIEKETLPGQRVWLPNAQRYLQGVEPIYQAIAVRWPAAKMLTSNGAQLAVVDMPRASTQP